MNLKNKNYMRGAEFKARQIWLPFVDAVGIVLEIMSDMKEKSTDWFKAWTKEFRTPRQVRKQTQLNLDFMRQVKDWANWTPKKNKNLFPA